MTSPPLDEDGFHSIAWDDAPARANPLSSGLHDVSADDTDGFEAISPASPGGVESVSTDTPTERERSAAFGSGTVRGARLGGETGVEDWRGRWMSIEVRDPMKEHEGSKDMFVSYAVRTKVSGGVLRE
jgi:sorting nexin-4